MSQPRKVTMAPPRQPLTRDSFTNKMAIYRRRISQTKGEVFDALNERISSEMQFIYDDCMESFTNLEIAQAENTQLIIRIKELESKLAKYEPKDKIKTPPK